MVMQSKRHDIKKLKICEEFKDLNKFTITNPFLTLFGNKIINEVEGHKWYSLTDEFLGYNQVPISVENQEKMNFALVFGSFAYKLMSFGLKNVAIMVLRIVVKEFQEYLYKIMVVYFDNLTIYTLLKDHTTWLISMLE